jgi:hypothetical protein
MPQVMHTTGGGSLIPVWYNGTAWTKLGGGAQGHKAQGPIEKTVNGTNLVDYRL